MAQLLFAKNQINVKIVYYGPAGAGKTTSFYMIVGLVPPNGGQVLFEGNDVTKMPMYQRARLGMGYLPQEESIFRKLTVEQNIMAVMETLKIPRKEKIERCNELLERFDPAPGGDLDAITRKAAARDPVERYGSVESLAEAFAAERARGGLFFDHAGRSAFVLRNEIAAMYRSGSEEVQEVEEKEEAQEVVRRPPRRCARGRPRLRLTLGRRGAELAR